MPILNIFASFFVVGVAVFFYKRIGYLPRFLSFALPIVVFLALAYSLLLAGVITILSAHIYGLAGLLLLSSRIAPLIGRG